MPKPNKPELAIELETIDACENCEDCEEPCEEPEAPELEPIDEPKPTEIALKGYIAEEGDTYASIAAKLAPAGKRHELAVALAILNKNKAIVPGTEIAVK